MEKINEIKIPKGVESISVKQHNNKIVIEFIPEKSKFKEGDFVYEDERIMIVHKCPHFYKALVYPPHYTKVHYNGKYGLPFSSPSFRFATEEEKQFLLDALEKDGEKWNAEKKCIEDIPTELKNGDFVAGFGCVFILYTQIGKYSAQYHALYAKTNGNLYYYKTYSQSGNIHKLKHATEEEKQELLDALAEKGKRWNAEKLEIEDILKEGDLAIFWGDNNLNPTIRLYHFKSYNGHTDNFGTIWGKAVKWDGTKEQFEKVLRGEIL